MAGLDIREVLPRGVVDRIFRALRQFLAGLEKRGGGAGYWRRRWRTSAWPFPVELLPTRALAYTPVRLLSRVLRYRMRAGTRRLG